MPQMRGVTMRPACGSLPWRMISKPRNMAASVQAEVTTPFSMVTRTSRSPSTRPSGLTNRSTAVMALSFFLDHEHVFLGPLRGSDPRGGRVGHIGEVVGALGHLLRDDAADLLRLEDGARGEVEERVLGLGAAGAGHARSRLGGLPVPQDAVAR